MSRIGELLVREKMLSLQQLQQAQDEAKRTGKRLGATLSRLGYVNDQALTQFVAKAGRRSLTFAPTNADVAELVDHETQSRWNPYGQCIAGRLKGSTLERLILVPEYWFAWSEFHRNTAIFMPK